MKKIAYCLLAFAALTSLAWALNGYSSFTNLYASNLFRVDGAATFNSTVSTTGAFSPTLVTIPAANTFTQTASSVSLTSPTVQFDATGKYYIEIQSNANQTGVRPTNGTLGQTLIIRSGSGSNTIRFDDNSTTMALGGNITLTEAQDDVLTLICTEAGTGVSSRWARLYNADN